MVRFPWFWYPSDRNQILHRMSQAMTDVRGPIWAMFLVFSYFESTRCLIIIIWTLKVNWPVVIIWDRQKNAYCYSSGSYELTRTRIFKIFEQKVDARGSQSKRAPEKQFWPDESSKLEFLSFYFVTLAIFCWNELSSTKCSSR